ncbi:MAG: c-type cytochrome [Sulfurisoma sp.]|nr:c-type cytochrome [Sulfurisoma sp.]
MSRMHPSTRWLRRHAAVTVLGLTLLALPPLVHAQDIPPLSERLQLCASCHAMDGNSVIPENPKISGMDAGYLERQMADFKSGVRKSPVMSGIIPLVDGKEFAALAGHFSAQKPGKGVAADPRLVAEGKAIFDEGIVGSAVPACSGCHNEDGSGTEKYPRVAGQHTAYVVQQMLNFKSGERANDSRALMRAVAKRMNEKEIRAVAEYVATLSGSE